MYDGNPQKDHVVVSDNAYPIQENGVFGAIISPLPLPNVWADQIC